VRMFPATIIDADDIHHLVCFTYNNPDKALIRAYV
jgi:hypothetical protein